jgi:hypothetical protein
VRSCGYDSHLAQSARRHQALAAHRVPEQAPDCAGIGPAVEDGADDLGLARARVAMLADVAVEAQRAVVLPLDQALLREKVNRQDLILGSANSRLSAFSRARVPSSSAPMSRL